MEKMIKFELAADEAEMVRFACHCTSMHFDELYDCYNRECHREEKVKYRQLCEKVYHIIQSYIQEGDTNEAHTH